MSKDINAYEEEYLADYGFEAEMVRYRAQQVLVRLADRAPRHVLEIGCGARLQAAEWQNAGGTWDRWTTVEPSQTFCEKARTANLPHFEVVMGFFEDVVDQLPGPEFPDMILCSGLLHEVSDASRLLDAIRGRMGPETVLHINVPNATSLHRRLARAMGLITDLTELSARNKTLQQPRVFDAETLANTVEAHDLIVIRSGGYLVKPFTHSQMAPLVETLGRDVFDGLNQLGVEMPELASEIFVEARRA